MGGDCVLDPATRSSPPPFRAPKGLTICAHPRQRRHSRLTGQQALEKGQGDRSGSARAGRRRHWCKFKQMHRQTKSAVGWFTDYLMLRQPTSQ